MFASRIGFWLAVAGAVFATLADSHARQTNGPPSTYFSSVQLETRRSSVEFLPDGDLSKPAWKHANWVEFDNDASGKFHYPEAATRVASLWTKTHIYFAFSCRYDSLNIYEGEDPKPERWQLWNRDVVEVFLNPQPERVSHYFEFEVAPNNQWIDLEIDKAREPLTTPHGIPVSSTQLASTPNSMFGPPKCAYLSRQ